MNTNFNDPIVAIATATGNGGIGVIRISGTKFVITGLVKDLFNKESIQSHKVNLWSLRDESGNIIDKAIVLYFEEPRSYTGESVLEIQAHGGRSLLAWIVEIVLKVGKKYSIRLASPGEFTERAFLNGKIDLVQAEAVADLISATSKNAIKAASRSLKGDFSKAITGLNDDLTNLRVQVEAILDFPEEEIDFLESYKISEQLDQILLSLKNLLAESRQGELLREGVKVALVGNTNVGKSSLMNCLAGDEVAIVTDIAGTTRDKIQTSINIDNLTFNLIDTAGIRETKDIVEKIGIERAKKEIQSADIILKIVDLTRKDIASEEDKELIQSLNQIDKDTPIVTVFNKADLVEKQEESVSRETTIFVSAKTGYGIGTLKKKLVELSGWKNNESVFIARERHILCLKTALEALEKGKDALEENVPLEIFAEELRMASLSFGEIVGKTTSDDLLGKIFSGFCIGK